MSKFKIILMACLLTLLFGNVYGQWGELRTEISPEITPGTVPVGVPVRIDVYFDLVDPEPPVLWFYLYGRFVGYNGLIQAEPVTPDSGTIYAGNVAVLNNFDANWNYGVYTYDLSWDGNLPDSFAYVGIGGGWAEPGEHLLFSFFFKPLQEGTFCLQTDWPDWGTDYAWDIDPLYPNINHCFNVVELGECADINDDGDINIFDVTEFITCKYILDPPCEIPLYRGDVNNNGKLNVFDIVTIISYIYRGGPAPNCPPPPEP